MQTFLPYSSFQASARVLDYRRLGKQRSEALVIVRAIEKGNGWSNHPVTKMWKDYVMALKLYHNVIIEEWIKRGYNNNMDLFEIRKPVVKPPWLGDQRLHRSHRSNLLRKDLEYYSQFGWNVPDNLGYFWPTKDY